MKTFVLNFPIAYLIQSISWPFENHVPNEEVVVVLKSDGSPKISARHASCNIY
jgi:hypothetical protein